MNPEFQRNLWLEATPRRLALVAGLILLALVAATSSPVDAMAPYQVAKLIYYFVVIGWGTRNAALAVVGEIRDRTWDAQRLSAIGPFSMTWGKLLGATAANWFGGFLCLGVVLGHGLVARAFGAALLETVQLLLLGLFAQAISLLASLMLVRRRQAQSRLDTFLCQVAGILAASSQYTAWQGAAFAQAHGVAFTISWWGMVFDGRAFQLASLAVFTLWALTGCYRMMRMELRMTNGPFVWLGYLLFTCVYGAGFDLGLFGKAAQGLHEQAAPFLGAIRLGIADLSLVTSAYAMALLEPKDPVRLRWLWAQARAGRLGTVFLALDAWMMSYAALAAVTLVLAFVTMHDAALAKAAGETVPAWASSALLPALAGLGFVTRDIGLCVAMGMSRQKRGEFGVLAVLVALYIMAPAVARAAAPDALLLFLPGFQPPSLAGVVVAWVEAAAMAGWAVMRLRRRA